MPPPPIPDFVLAAVEGSAGRVVGVRAVGGGCVAHASRVETDAGPVFLKWAAGAAGAGFEGEAAGLTALAASAPAGIVVPRALASIASTDRAPGYLLTEWIEPASPGRDAWPSFGAALAHLHGAASAGDGRYGFATATYCGPTRQPNDWSEHWPTFFRERRLLYLAAQLRRAGRWSGDLDGMLGAAVDRLDDLLPARPTPSLLHGDLWRGNVFPAQGDVTALVDPATYIGDRETDLAMAELFGGFDESFIPSYLRAWPLEPGYDRRRRVYQLYHLMNHLLLFGGHYAAAVARTLREITA